MGGFVLFVLLVALAVWWAIRRDQRRADVPPRLSDRFPTADGSSLLPDDHLHAMGLSVAECQRLLRGEKDDWLALPLAMAELVACGWAKAELRPSRGWPGYEVQNALLPLYWESHGIPGVKQGTPRWVVEISGAGECSDSAVLSDVVEILRDDRVSGFCDNGDGSFDLVRLGQLACPAWRKSTNPAMLFPNGVRIRLQQRGLLQNTAPRALFLVQRELRPTARGQEIRDVLRHTRRDMKRELKAAVWGRVAAIEALRLRECELLLMLPMAGQGEKLAQLGLVSCDVVKTYLAVRMGSLLEQPPNDSMSFP